MKRQRPPGLPDYNAPPVTEVVVGIQFDALTGLRAAHLGVIWEAFRTDFPELEEHPPLPPTFETFGQNPAFVSMLPIQIIGSEIPRVFFINERRTLLLQVQRDRFIHNWRKLKAEDIYPHFEQMLETLEENYAKFRRALSSVGLPEPHPNQCELTYVNQIDAMRDGQAFQPFGDIFPEVARALDLPRVGAPEDARFMARYALRSPSGEPYGRIIVSVEPARRSDGKLILQLTFTARGRPLIEGDGGVIDFLTTSRVQLVQAFRALMGDEVQRKWGLRE